MPKVCIVNPNNQYITMFLKNGWEIVDDMPSADLVQFTGGEDVTPQLYGEVPHPNTFCSLQRDKEEQKAYILAIKLGIPMAGICRGGQFLNVMCGGSMYQHVDNHAVGGTHDVWDTKTNLSIPCTSTHHQMMRPTPKGKILGTASEAKTVEYMVRNSIVAVSAEKEKDVEVVLYEEKKVLCFQPHPEYLPTESLCQRWYFDLIEEELGVA